MNNQIEAILEEVEKFNQSIKDALNSKNISDTGEAARSLRTEFGSDYVRSLGVFYLEFLDTGRGAGEPPPFRKILEWAIRRTGKDASGAYGLAVYVTNKIAEIGTKIFIDNSKGIELHQKIVTLRKAINQSVTDSVVIDIRQRLDKYKKIYQMSF
jgi:hypothetical protein